MRLLWLLCLLSFEAAAQTANERPERSDVRELRRDALLGAQEFVEHPTVDYKLLLGAAYTDAESGATAWATPFYFRVRFNERKTFFKVSGDGYVQTRTNEGEAAGLANVNLAIAHTLLEGLRGTLGITIPSGSAVGSEQGRERVGLSYERTLYGPWSGGIEFQLVRYDADPDPGESRVRRQGLVQAAYNFEHSKLVVVQLERLYRPGVTSATVASFGYQMPIWRNAAGPVLGVATLSRGLSPNLHDTTLELDVCVRF